MTHLQLNSQFGAGASRQWPSRLPRQRRPVPRLIVVFLVLLAALGLAVEAKEWWARPRPTPPTTIFQGITYACIDTNEPECRGLVHMVKVDLTAPGIGLYLTPVDPAATARGWQYRLDSAASVLEREKLAVVVNAAFFTSDSGIVQQSGDLANSVQTIVADRAVNQIDPNSYLLWFEPDRTPHLEFEKPPKAAILRQARWGVGGGAIPLWKGKLRESAASHEMDRRTAIGIDTGRKLLWLAVFENASSTGVARILAQNGVQDGFLLDGGHSTTMVLGASADHVRTGEMLHGWRPVATFLGIRAEPLNSLLKKGTGASPDRNSYDNISPLLGASPFFPQAVK